ncbi:Myotubularin [Hondaea fermentalgiana]|uniref:Myotubularin n=1 Tax=Hondaea fermentalgiana TaxID=2315210 RepID=A0A2R5GQF6_9STRA|nr:Myotubularin [Hondaea fermentalgiana]|eukprot:GBG33097.1 Myotubularin [Hondaea fermentalgiana]
MAASLRTAAPLHTAWMDGEEEEEEEDDDAGTEADSDGFAGSAAESASDAEEMLLGAVLEVTPALEVGLDPRQQRAGSTGLESLRAKSKSSLARRLSKRHITAPGQSLATVAATVPAASLESAEDEAIFRAVLEPDSAPVRICKNCFQELEAKKGPQNGPAPVNAVTGATRASRKGDPASTAFVTASGSASGPAMPGSSTSSWMLPGEKLVGHFERIWFENEPQASVMLTTFQLIIFSPESSGRAVACIPLMSIERIEILLNDVCEAGILNIYCKNLRQPKSGPWYRRSIADEKLIREIALTAKSGLVIVDARPPSNASANRIKAGGGFEDIANYNSHTGQSPVSIEFMNLENTKTVRASMNKLKRLVGHRLKQQRKFVLGPHGKFVLADAHMHPGAFELDDEEAVEFEIQWLTRLADSRWMHLLSYILRASCRVVQIVKDERKSVLVHCSDGWDRTAQIVSLAVLCMDGYYRTLRGFVSLVEKDWLSLLHQFPAAFEFSEGLLVTILDRVYSAQFGNFLVNTRKEALDHQLPLTSYCAWDDLLQDPGRFENPVYQADSQTASATLRPAFGTKNLQLWRAYFLRYDQTCRDEDLASMPSEVHEFPAAATLEASNLMAKHKASGTHKTSSPSKRQGSLVELMINTSLDDAQGSLRDARAARGSLSYLTSDRKSKNERGPKSFSKSDSNSGDGDKEGSGCESRDSSEAQVNENENSNSKSVDEGFAQDADDVDVEAEAEGGSDAVGTFKAEPFGAEDSESSPMIVARAQSDSQLAPLQP